MQPNNQNPLCRSKSLLLLFFIAFTIPSTLFAQEKLFAKDFGILPNSFQDQSENIQKALHACKKNRSKSIIFEAGRYDFYPEKSSKRELYISNTASETEWPDKTKHIGILIEDTQDLTLVGNSAEFVFHGKMTPFAIIRSANIKLEGFNTSFERPTMSEMSILNSSDSEITVNVHPTSKYNIFNGKVYWYGEGWYAKPELHTIITDTLSGLSQYSSFKPFEESQAQEIQINQIRFKGKFNPSDYPVGSILSMRNTIRDEVGGFVYRSKNIELSNINIHYMHGLGITSQFSENLNYQNIKITPAKGRAISAFADGMHFSGCKGKINIFNCHYQGLHDDPVNIHGTYLQIEEILKDNQLIVEFKHHQTYGMDAFIPSDTIAIVSQEAIQSLGNLKVESVETINPRKVKITYSGKLSPKAKVGDAVENLTWTPEVKISNNTFERTNTRGLLISTPKKVTIENNTFYRTGMHAILIAADVNSWFESGAVKDVTIRNNKFIDCGYNQTPNGYAIAILPENKVKVNKHFVHRNIRIEDNIFESFNRQILMAKSVDGLTFNKNKIEIGQEKPEFISFKNDSMKFIVLDDVQNVIIQKNDVNMQELKVDIMNSDKRKIKTDLPMIVISKDH